jgi:hypothetical protein
MSPIRSASPSERTSGGTAVTPHETEFVCADALKAESGRRTPHANERQNLVTTVDLSG